MNDSTIRGLCPGLSEIDRLRAGTAGLVRTNIKVRPSRSGTESAWLGPATLYPRLRFVQPTQIYLRAKSERCLCPEQEWRTSNRRLSG
jgi:hypothetical protein